jgi:hypothetical protein
MLQKSEMISTVILFIFSNIYEAILKQQFGLFLVRKVFLEALFYRIIDLSVHFFFLVRRIALRFLLLF